MKLPISQKLEETMRSQQEEKEYLTFDSAHATISYTKIAKTKVRLSGKCC